MCVPTTYATSRLGTKLQGDPCQ
jgi:hypothetical protein